MARVAGMVLVRRGDVDGVDLRIVAKRFDGGMDPAAEFRREPPRRLDARVGRRDRDPPRDARRGWAA
jgi:hypothetical protein